MGFHRIQQHRSTTKHLFLGFIVIVIGFGAISYFRHPAIPHTGSPPPFLPWKPPPIKGIDGQQIPEFEQEISIQTTTIPESPCRKNFGKVAIFMIFTNYASYSHASNTLRCYAQSKGYEVFLVHAYEDPLSSKECGKLQDVFFRKHCVASIYLEKADWMMVSDADTAVLNSNHCIEEYIDEKADLIFYERYFSSEVTSGNYLVKNTRAAKHFLRGWAEMEFEKPPPPIFSSSDNGLLHLHLIRVLFPENLALHSECFSYLNESVWPKYIPGFGKFIGCAKRALITMKSSEKARAKVKILQRAHAWVRDTVFTGHNIWEGDFMAHGIKHAEPFNTTMLERLARFANNTIPQECWNPGWRPVLVMGQMMNQTQILSQLRHNADSMEKGEMKPVFGDLHFEKCWPKCPPLFQNF